MIIIPFTIITALYAFCVFFGIQGWNRNQKRTSPPKYPFISVIIAARNEQKHIGNLLQSLIDQDYPKELFEILVINDNSDDRTEEIAFEYKKKSPHLFIHNAPKDCSGKKAAISYGISLSKGDYLFFTDADCIVPTSWISTYIQHVPLSSQAFLFGPVQYAQETKIVQYFFSLDFLAIIAMQGGWAKNKRAFSCNAANMVISKELSILPSNIERSSGDDVFLLHAAKKNPDISIHFIQEPNVLVHTSQPESLKDFLKQRIRWSSKSSDYTDFDAILLSGIMYITNASIFASGVLSVIDIQFIWIFIYLLGAKASIDFIFFNQTLSFFNKKKLQFLSIPFQLFYSIYITLIPIFAIITPLKWKGRKIT